MIKVNCIKCNSELNEQGALIFKHPEGIITMVHKLHLCRECEKLLDKWLLNKT